MSSGGDEPVSTSQSFTAFWMAGPGSPAPPIVGNPVTPSDLAALNSSVASAQQVDLTTMTNAVPQDDFTSVSSQHT